MVKYLAIRDLISLERSHFNFQKKEKNKIMSCMTKKYRKA